LQSFHNARMTWLIATALLGILASLGSALFFMLRRSDQAASDGDADDTRRSRAMWRALALRVALSVALFVCMLLAAKLGWISPTGWGARS